VRIPLLAELYTQKAVGHHHPKPDVVVPVVRVVVVPDGAAHVVGIVTEVSV
jgi:hypothetical protein